jgi:L-alanine-DL-glutamate epimerase-like enolase superfamily enzyme
MRILAIHDSTVAIGTPMRNAAIAFDTMTASALAVVTDQVVRGERVIGYAFDSIGRYAKSGLLRERFIPRLLGAPPAALCDASGVIDPAAAVAVMMQNEKSGGHGERPGAVGLLDAALWDARAKAQGQPLWRSLAQQFGCAGAGPDIAVYASCGHVRPGEPLRALQDEVASALDRGYRLVKIKAGGDPRGDRLRIEAAAQVLGPERLAADLNGSLDAAGWARWAAAIAPLGLAWVEEPCEPLDFEALAGIARTTALPLATGENLFSFADARNLLRYGGLRPATDRIQVDPLLSYGVGEYLQILRLYQSSGWSPRAFAPHAGHLYAAHLVAGLGLGAAEAAPDPALSYGGFWDHVPVREGRVRIPELPGVGYEAKAHLFAHLEPLPGGTAI